MHQPNSIIKKNYWAWMVTCLVMFSYPVTTLAAVKLAQVQAVPGYPGRPGITVVQTSSKPLPIQVSWTTAEEFERIGPPGYVIDHWELVLTDNPDFNNAKIYQLNREQSQLELNRTEGGLRPLQQYFIRFAAAYEDAPFDKVMNNPEWYLNLKKKSEGVHQDAFIYFCTGVPKITGLSTQPQAAGRLLTWNDKLSWRYLNINYAVQIYQVINGEEKLWQTYTVPFNSDHRNQLQLNQLSPATHYTFKVRGYNKDTYGKGQWSEHYAFHY